MLFGHATISFYYPSCCCTTDRVKDSGQPTSLLFASRVGTDGEWGMINNDWCPSIKCVGKARTVDDDRGRTLAVDGAIPSVQQNVGCFLQPGLCPLPDDFHFQEWQCWRPRWSKERDTAGWNWPAGLRTLATKAIVAMLGGRKCRQGRTAST
mmetsp:Transcript_10942/g.30712  ORF Transcript_10942/g.30712 Transcript_10942/m.30712 type:complete len:152 (+) Transcript_10942:89-544(+)